MPQNPTAQGSTPLGSLFVILVALTFSLAWGVLISVPGVAFPDEYALPIPAEVLPPLIPDDNPLSAAKVELGQKLYFDPRLSVDNTVSCATCHDPRKGFADGKPVGEGVKQQKGARNSPTVLNAAYYEQQFWDGRAEMLEDQAVLPLINPIEMAMPSHGAVEDKLRKLPEYPPLFRKAFGKPEITISRVGQALASFERTLVSFSAPIDRFLKGDKSAISESAQRGWTLFNGKARCNTCHGHVGSVPTFTDNKYHNIGVGAKQRDFSALARETQQALQKGDRKIIDELALKPHVSELGRFLVTKEQKDLGAFKTSGLRNVELTAPYMHDGSEATLLAVIDFYDRGGENNPFLDGGMRPLGLNDQQKSDLVELMKTFTSDDLKRFDALKSLMPAQ
ncbi:MAG: cytochrome-c peroxidase [Deltaproteobacteria bacterium]|nr:cytochrome-c peroxidase [Deltaproteobacteria bacterium]